MNDEQKRKERSSSLQRRPRSSTGKPRSLPRTAFIHQSWHQHQPSEHKLTILPSQENQQVALDCGGERRIKEIPHYTTGQEDRPTLPTGTRGNRKESQGRNYQGCIRCNLQAIQKEGMCRSRTSGVSIHLANSTPPTHSVKEITLTTPLQADDELEAPVLAGFEWDKEESWTRLVVHCKKEGAAPVTKKSKKKAKEDGEE